MSDATFSFGQIAIEPKPVPQASSFWSEAAREHFYQRCVDEWHERLRGSRGEALVGQVPIIGMFKDDQPSRGKRA